MRARISRFTIVLPMLFLAACATTPVHQALPSGAEDKIASTDVVLPIHQNEIYVFVPNSNASAAMGGGLLAALIDAGINDVRTTKAEDAVKPLRDVLVDYNFDAGLQSDLKDALSQVNWLHPENYRVVRDITNDGLDGVLTGSKDAAVLFVSADYRLTNDADVLDIVVAANLYPNSDALKAFATGKSGSGPKTSPANAIYRNSFAYEFKLPGSTDDRDRNIAAWSANNGAAMRAALDAGAKQLAAMVTADLQDGDQPASGAAKVTVQNSAGPVAVDISGTSVSNDGAGQLVRFDDGTLEYLQTSAPSVVSAPSASPTVSGADSAHPEG